jgi:hypothetical protein
MHSNSVFTLPAGQIEDPSPELVTAIRAALETPEATTLAEKCASSFFDLIAKVGERHFLEYGQLCALEQGESVIDVLNRSLASVEHMHRLADEELSRSMQRLTIQE